ncbi:MAG: PIN domain nuclease [Chloroflexi bacterium]|nr:PIN domain nuclease [Chloroflexota bacterium]
MFVNGLIVLIRIVGAIFFGFIGLRTGQALAEGDTGLTRIIFWVAPPVGFTIFGAMATPLVLLPPIRKFQEWAQQIKPMQMVLGIFGLIAGLLVSALLTPWLVTLPGVGGFLAPLVMSFLLGTLGVAALVSREEEFAAFLGRYLPGLAKTGWGSRDIVIDTSAIIDGRITDVAQTGFLQGTLVVPRFVLDELRHIADSPDALRRNRGRRGLEVLGRLQKDAPIPIRVAEEDFEDARDVDAKLIRLAKKLNAPILTNDFNLNRIAELEDLKVLNVNELANAVKVVVLPGEEMAVRIIQEGKEMGQGVGFLDDGTMVVVEGGRRYLNEQLDVIVTRVLQTMAGRMIFAQPKGA